MMTRFKRWTAAALCGAVMLGCAGCQENPKSTAVVHKDFDRLLSEAGGAEGGGTDVDAIREEVSGSERYQTTLEEESLHVKVTVDAEVDVPEVGTLSVYRVRQKAFDADFVEKVRQALVGDEQLYDASVLSTETKQELEDRIAQGRKAYQAYEAELRGALDENGEPLYSEEEIEQNLEQMEWEYVGVWEEAYENAPDAVDYGGYAIDGKLRPVSELYAENAERYSYFNDLIPEGDLVDGVTDGSGGLYKSFKALNSEDYSNWMLYEERPDKAARSTGGGVLAPTTNLNTGAYYAGGQPQNPNLPENFLSNGYGWTAETKFVPLEGDGVTLTEAEAAAKAEAFLEQIGLGGFVCGTCGLYSEFADPDDYDAAADTITYRRYYILQFFREVDGVPLTQSSGSKYSEENEDKRIWPGETVELRINDRGVVGFEYASPVEISETVVSDAAMKPFAEIRDTFEQMVCISNASEYENTAVRIDRVRLSYSRISEKDAFDSGLIVPVWSFEGCVETAVDGVPLNEREGTVMAINGIDGSVIDRAAGY